MADRTKQEKGFIQMLFTSLQQSSRNIQAPSLIRGTKTSANAPRRFKAVKLPKVQRVTKP